MGDGRAAPRAGHIGGRCAASEPEPEPERAWVRAGKLRAGSFPAAPPRRRRA